MADDKDWIKTVITSGILGTLSAGIRTLLTKNETTVQKISNFFAGVIASVVIGFIIRNTNLSEFWRELIASASGAFISQVWPNIESFVKRFVNKKSNDILGNINNTNEPSGRNSRNNKPV